MDLALVQPSLNASAVPLSYPPLSAPDTYNCEGYYSYPDSPKYDDCQSAWIKIPGGTTPIPWYTESAPGQERNVLPLKVSHGTCEIIFHTSGQSAETVDPTFVVPDDIRGMAAHVLDKCGRSNKGGMVTKGLGKTVDAMLDTSVTRFPNPPLPPSSSFYSLHVWNYATIGTDNDWNPGNNDPDTGGAIADALCDAIQAAERGSARRKELSRRQEYLWRAVGPMTYGDPTTNWWDGTPPRLALNGTGGAVKLTHGCYANDGDGAAASA